MPELDIRRIYDSLASKRDKFLDAAEDVAALTIPHIEPRGREIQATESRPRQPYTHAGAMAVRSLGSSLFKIMMPPGVKWGELDLTPPIWQAIEVEVGLEQAEIFRRALSNRSSEVIESLDQKLSRSRGAKALRRNLVEGNTLIVNQTDSIRVYPLRSFVMERENGIPRLLVLKEEFEPDPAEQLMKDRQEHEALYTMVRWPHKHPITGAIVEGGVWKQRNDQAAKSVNEHPAQYFVIVPEIPEYEDYSYSYTYDFLRLIAQINHGEQSLGEAMFAAAYNRPIIREGSSTAQRWAEFIRGRSGEPWVGNVEDFGWFISNLKINDWAFIVQLMERWSLDLATAFAMGLKDRPVGTGTSATEVLQIVDELNTQIQDLHTAYEHSFQRALFMSELTLMESVNPLFGTTLPPQVQELMKIEITTGTTVLGRQQAMLKFGTQFLPAVAGLDPRLVVNGGPLVDAFSDAMPFRTENFYSWQAEMPQPQMPEQAGMAEAGPNGQVPAREEVIMTPGGPQPPQPPQGPPPSPIRG